MPSKPPTWKISHICPHCGNDAESGDPNLAKAREAVIRAAKAWVNYVDDGLAASASKQGRIQHAAGECRGPAGEAG